MLFNYALVMAFIFLGCLFIFACLTVGRFVRPSVKHPEKTTIYECGERPIGEAWFNFNPRFYILALIFIVFDVEISITIPVVVVLKQWISQGRGGIAVVEILFFLFFIALALAYVWKNNDIHWQKHLDHSSPLKEDERKYYHY
ncbi:MAG: NADH-quinone oxidoreductase subunit A [Desulfobacula sp.]|nr:NADH-quinone oxidoreductase subunit A [Desulfobacula sp.]